jgi:hypothetical protein
MPRPRSEESSNDDEFDQLGVRRCERLPAGFPDEWRDLQLSVGVGLILTEWNGVNRSFFDEFAVSSVAGAIAMLTKNHEAFLTYQFFVDEVYPAFKWDADWPLWRRRDSTVVHRSMVQGAQPWVWHGDRTLFEIRREPLRWWTGRLYLRVGGRSQAAAAHTWDECAKPLRHLYRESAQALKRARLPDSHAHSA